MVRRACGGVLLRAHHRDVMPAIAVTPLPIDRVIVERIDPAQTGIPGCVNYTITGRTVDEPSRHVQYQTLSDWRASLCERAAKSGTPVLIRWRQTAYAKDISRVEIAKMSDKLWERDGGPAFPQNWTEAGSKQFIVHGMSLRDYFASHAPLGHAVQRILEENKHPESIERIMQTTAGWAYAWADAMLRERAKQP